MIIAYTTIAKLILRALKKVNDARSVAIKRESLAKQRRKLGIKKSMPAPMRSCAVTVAALAWLPRKVAGKNGPSMSFANADWREFTGFQIGANTLSSSWPSARPRLA
jgi:hypothetical protein